MQKNEIWISVDIEADGPIPGMYSMSSLGASCVFDPTKKFYVELKPISEFYDLQAASVSGLKRDDLQYFGHSAKDAMVEFHNWLRILDGKPIFCSFSSWDWVFVYWYFMKYIGESPFGHSSLDIKSYYAGAYKAEWRGTSKRSIRKDRYHLLKDLGPHTHNALDDALEQGEILRRITGR